MKSETPNSRKSGAGRKSRGTGVSQLPMEWMDPLSWRLPSGKALAEFALQTGFLAPLMMRAPELSRTRKPAEKWTGMGMSTAAKQSGVAQERLEEAPARTASFRHHR